MATTTKTLGPLHFEDLEPKRFEDLVRQLAYEFKPWRKLEATGRSGSDDGFDARGYEIVGGDTAQRSSDGEAEAVDETAVCEGAEDRLWLIQCKRERAIGPKALTDYLDGIVLSSDEKLYGMVFTAAADFSKKARDDFAKKCKAMGLQEWHLWGKAELEDKLFQPAADHLLFAYFGISLTIRRRTQRTELRARLAMKRKANRLLKDYQHQFLLLRPPEAPSYPHSRDVRDPETGEPPWFVREYRQMSHEGLVFCVRRYFAYLHDDGEQWDAAMAFNHVRSSPHQDPWQREEEDHELRSRIQEASPLTGDASMLLLIAEAKAIVPARHGHKLVIKHVPDVGFALEPSLYHRLRTRFEPELTLWSATDDIHLIIIATFGIGPELLPHIAELSLMTVDRHWLPVETMGDRQLLDRLVRAHRSFLRLLRYDLSPDTRIPAVVLTDRGDVPEAVFVQGLDEAISHQCAGARRSSSSDIAWHHASVTTSHGRRETKT